MSALTERVCRFLLDDKTQCPNAAQANGLYCTTHSDRSLNDLEVYKVVAERFGQDLELFWTRANFYLIVQAGLLSVFTTTLSQSMPATSLVKLGICLLGFVLAVFWFWVLRGSIYWIRKWREEIIEMDRAVSRFQAYAKIESIVLKSKTLSPSWVTSNLPLVFMVAWLGLGVAVIFIP